MHLPVAPNSLVETNLLLRALWAQLRKEYGKLAWQFSPVRHGERNTIYFGWADLGLGSTIRVGVTYKRRGVASGIVFEDAAAQEPRIRKCVNDALASVQNTATFHFLVPVQMSLDVQMADIAGQNIVFESQKEGMFRLGIRVQAFDPPDAESEMRRRVRLILDALSFLTNVVYRVTASADSEDAVDAISGGLQGLLGGRFRSVLPQWFRALTRRAMVATGRFRHPASEGKIRTPSKMPDADWLDGYPVVDRLLIVSEQGMKLLDTLAGEEFDDRVAMLADAAHHFHNGLVAEERRFDPTTVGAGTEQAIVFYMSALEVASLIGAPEPASCTACGQPQHRISARVTEFVEKKLGGAVPSIIKMLYTARSTYLHRGLLLSSRSYAGATIPQLDPSSTTGVLAPISVAPVLNLREFSSYCLRRVADECTGSPPPS